VALSHKLRSGPFRHGTGSKSGGSTPHTETVPRVAPRYDERLLRLARTLDDESQPMAETCRRVGAAAEKLGLARPSYVHLRRILTAERARRRELRELRERVREDFARHRVVDLAEIALELRDIEDRRALGPRS
jgi:hypothetical protein